MKSLPESQLRKDNWRQYSYKFHNLYAYLHTQTIHMYIYIYELHDYIYIYVQCVYTVYTRYMHTCTTGRKCYIDKKNKYIYIYICRHNTCIYVVHGFVICIELPSNINYHKLPVYTCLYRDNSWFFLQKHVLGFFLFLACVMETFEWVNPSNTGPQPPGIAFASLTSSLWAAYSILPGAAAGFDLWPPGQNFVAVFVGINTHKISKHFLWSVCFTVVSTESHKFFLQPIFCLHNLELWCEANINFSQPSYLSQNQSQHVRSCKTVVKPNYWRRQRRKKCSAKAMHPIWCECAHMFTRKDTDTIWETHHIFDVVCILCMLWLPWAYYEAHHCLKNIKYIWLRSPSARAHRHLVLCWSLTGRWKPGIARTPGSPTVGAGLAPRWTSSPRYHLLMEWDDHIVPSQPQHSMNIVHLTISWWSWELAAKCVKMCEVSPCGTAVCE